VEVILVSVKTTAAREIAVHLDWQQIQVEDAHDEMYTEIVVHSKATG
jgi:ribosome-associated translation inhibitor RaiA